MSTQLLETVKLSLQNPKACKSEGYQTEFWSKYTDLNTSTTCQILLRIKPESNASYNLTFTPDSLLFLRKIGTKQY